MRVSISIQVDRDVDLDWLLQTIRDSGFDARGIVKERVHPWRLTYPNFTIQEGSLSDLLEILNSEGLLDLSLDYMRGWDLETITFNCKGLYKLEVNPDYDREDGNLYE